MASDADAWTGTRAPTFPPARGRPPAVPTAAPRAGTRRDATPLSRGPPRPRVFPSVPASSDAHAKLPPSRAIPQVASILFVVGVVFILSASCV